MIEDRDHQGVIGGGVMNDELECNANCTLKCVAMSNESFAKITQIRDDNNSQMITSRPVPIFELRLNHPFV